MAVASLQIAATDGPQVIGSDVVFDVAGATLDNSSVCQFNYDDTVFVGIEGKQRLIAYLELIKVRLNSAKLWPATAAS
jgi:hypothetical protein